MIADDMISFIKNDIIIFGFGVFVFRAEIWNYVDNNDEDEDEDESATWLLTMDTKCGTRWRSNVYDNLYLSYQAPTMGPHECVCE